MHLKKAAIVFNPKGGSASENTVRQLAELLKDRGAEVLHFPTTPAPGSARSLACQAADDAAVDLVIAFGGDGTACQVAEGLIESKRSPDVAMAVYPGGTGNLFAKSFYSNPSPERFVEMIATGTPQPIDMISANYNDQSGQPQRQLFMVAMGLGTVSDAIGSASPALKRIFGRLVYVFRVALACLWPHARRFKLKVSGSAGTGFSVVTPTMFVLNVVPSIMPFFSRGCNASDGLMDIVIFPATNVWQLIKVVFWLAFAKPEHSRHYKRIRASQVTIRCDQPMLPNIDGDPAKPTNEIRLKVQPAAVRMLVC